MDRTLPLKTPEFVSVRDFGAVGDGHADDYPAIAAAIASLSPPGGTIFFPTGVYLVRQTIKISQSGVRLAGDGSGATTLRSGVIGASLFGIGEPGVAFVRVEDMTLAGNGLTGGEGNGHAINFIDAAINSGTHSPQNCQVQRLRITGFKGTDKENNGDGRLQSCAIIQHDGLAIVYRDLYIEDCGHGLYMRLTQGARIVNCVVNECQKYAIVAYGNENLIVEQCTLLNSGDGIPAADYPVPGAPSSLFFSGANEGLVLHGNKLKNTAGKALYVACCSNSDLLEGNWLRASMLANVPHKAIYAERCLGLVVTGNTFSSACTDWEGQKFENLELFTDQTREAYSAVITNNLFMNPSGMDVAYHMKIGGDRIARRFSGLVITGNRFGQRQKPSALCVVDRAIYADKCRLIDSCIEDNTFYAPEYTAYKACVELGQVDAENNSFLRNSGSPNGGTIAALYKGVTESAATLAVLESYAQLREFPVPGGRVPPTVQVLGAAMRGDGGAGTFFWESFSAGDAVPDDDEGTLIRSTVGRGIWRRLFSGAVDLAWFDAGEADAGKAKNSTEAFNSANRAGLYLKVPAGRTFYLENWVPLAGTTLDCTGATIWLWSPPVGNGLKTHSANPEPEDLGEDYAPRTEPRASIVIRKDNLTLIGGVFEEGPEGLEGPPMAPWTGCILVGGGSHIAIRECEFRYAWSGLFGWELPDPQGAKATDLIVTRCYFHDCSHNIYLSDIDRLTIDACRSYNSHRDGIKTARNCSNITITNNYLYDNGNDSGDAQGQSMDGIDLFAGGRRCVITGNYIHGNRVKGLDIKRADHPEDTPTNHDCELIIANNHIFANADSGVEIEFHPPADYPGPALYVENVSIAGNHIHGNQLWGARLGNCLHLSVTNNTIYDNCRDGLRIEGCPAGALVSGNLVYGNGLWMNGCENPAAGEHRSGIHVLGNLDRTLVQANLVYDRLAGTQLHGIVRQTDDCTNIEGNQFLTDNGLRASTACKKLKKLERGDAVVWIGEIMDAHQLDCQVCCGSVLVLLPEERVRNDSAEVRARVSIWKVGPGRFRVSEEDYLCRDQSIRIPRKQNQAENQGVVKLHPSSCRRTLRAGERLICEVSVIWGRTKGATAGVVIRFREGAGGAP